MAVNAGGHLENFGLSLLNYSKYYEVVVLYFPLYFNKKSHCFKSTRFPCQYVWRNPRKMRVFVPNAQNHHVSEPDKIKTQMITNKHSQRLHPLFPPKKEKTKTWTMKKLILPVLGLENTIIWINIVFSSVKKVSKSPTYIAAAKLKWMRLGEKRTLQNTFQRNCWQIFNPDTVGCQ